MDIVDLVLHQQHLKIYISSLINDHHREFVCLCPDASVLIWPTCTSLDHEIQSEALIFQQSMGNFVNAPYSLAMRHQLYQCYLNLNGDDLPGWTHAHNSEAGPGSASTLICCTCLIFKFV